MGRIVLNKNRNDLYNFFSLNTDWIPPFNEIDGTSMDQCNCVLIIYLYLSITS